ncbi:MAG: DUF1587 domain-containing protein, partial [Verrucomicrobiae bacterium]|nr:DUF1587 domain-containing protein [Verrucomicrobiae bacterium]
MTARSSRLQTSALTVWLVGLLGGSAGAAELPESVAAFLDRHCYECHDADVAKGKLNLADFAFDPANGDNLAKWERVFDRVRAGEMPPEKKPRPEAPELDRFLADLKAPLVAADRAEATENGRVRSRRLTRVEYEYTVHDLLGIDIPLKDLLPEDP